MPTPTEILAGLTEIARQGTVVAIGWHVVLAAALAALALGWRPSRRLAGALLALPLASVAAFALAYGNPFNGAMFSVAAVALAALALTGDGGAVAAGTSWTRWCGAAMIAFGWAYPHFLDGSPLVYLYAAPLGLVPCPTLSTAIGLALLAGGLGSRAWIGALGGLGAFYGLFGVLRLGVVLDVGLIAGAVGLLVVAARPGVARAPLVRRAHAT